MALSAGFRNIATLVPITLAMILFANMLLDKLSLWQNRPTMECQISDSGVSARVCLKAVFVKLDAYNKILNWEVLQQVQFAAIPHESLKTELAQRISKSYAPDLIKNKLKNFFSSTVQRLPNVRWQQPDGNGEISFDLRFGDYWICGLNRSDSIIEEADRIRCIKTQLKGQDSLTLLVQSQLVEPALSFYNLNESGDSEASVKSPQWQSTQDLIEPLVTQLLVQTTSDYGFIYIDADLASEVEVWPRNNDRAKIRLSTPLKKFKLRPGSYQIRLENMLSEQAQIKSFNVGKRQMVSLKFDLKQLMKRN